MQIQLKTKVLQALTNKVVKGLGNNKILPITEMMGINIEGNKLALVSTDGTNKVEVFTTLEEELTDMHIAVPGSSFVKLISKTTSENVIFLIEENRLTVKGNGVYTFSLPTDEDDNLITLLNITLPLPENGSTQEIETHWLQDSYSVNKGSVASTLEVPAYTGFYYDSKYAITTDSLKISSIQHHFSNNSMLLSASFVKLFTLLGGEKTIVMQTNSEIFLQSGGVVLQGVKMPEVLSFPISDIEPFLNINMSQCVRVNKQALLNILERLALFVSPFDENIIRLDFTKQGLMLWNLKGTSNELLPYIQVENLQDFSAKVSLVHLKSIISSNSGEELEIHFGIPEALKFTAGVVTQIVALHSENETI